jgi:hypothetical protein
MKIPNLLSATRKDVMTREFRCDGTDAPEAGAQVLLCRRADGVVVLVGGRVVGAVAAPEAEASSLQTALEIGCGLLRASVMSRSVITPSFVVRLQVNP